ncbi:MAG: deoxyribodipyrimidine photo-lyase [Rhodothermales bacterium]|nr:deoxyribodipyrimidine photo-lyase [Rhodothermales bacterium]MBO6778043.1 deoxyribodipyrimidine photo-lyase [Rhodothermales bacterium]
MIDIVWFKRDLRVRDHRPLVEAAASGRPLLCLYVYEPGVLRSDGFDPSHLVFINECLQQLAARLNNLGNRLVTTVGEMSEVLPALHAQVGIHTIWSHEETGNRVTYDRDLGVAAWARTEGVQFREIPNHGVFRPLKTRDGWAARWRKRMNQPITATPTVLPASPAIRSAGILGPPALGLPASTKHTVQKGGESLAQETLHDFLRRRGVNYRKDMSSPVEGWTGCSRVSPYLAWGAISVRDVFQQTRGRVLELKDDPERDSRWLSSLSSFEKRLRWHCHFIQKLEDEPAIEFENMNRSFDGMREDEFRDDWFAAWCAGRTGYPMVDACMRALLATGWINFRMRAMLVSFASNHLWLHWRPTSVFLAQHFLDFEPGIHFSQFQMQSGTTGINTVRIYSPTKQAKDQDPEGLFIREWVPELRKVPTGWIAEPWTMPPLVQQEAGCVIGRDYPAPIVEHGPAYREARTRVWGWKAKPEVREESQRVYERHGSRRRPVARR